MLLTGNPYNKTINFYGITTRYKKIVTAGLLFLSN